MFTLFTPFDEFRDFLSKPILEVINLDPDTTIQFKSGRVLIFNTDSQYRYYITSIFILIPVPY